LEKSHKRGGEEFKKISGLISNYNNKRIYNQIICKGDPEGRPNKVKL